MTHERVVAMHVTRCGLWGGVAGVVTHAGVITHALHLVAAGLVWPPMGGITLYCKREGTARLCCKRASPAALPATPAATASAAGITGKDSRLSSGVAQVCALTRLK